MDPATAVSTRAATGECLTTSYGTAGLTGDMVWHRFGAGPPLILLHGGWGSWTHWFKCIPALSRAFTVYAADTPGLGASSDVALPHTPEKLSGLIVSGIDQLLGPGTAFHIAGFSFGGMLGSLVAATMGQRCLSYTAVGASGFGPLHAPPGGIQLPEDGMDDDAINQLHRRNLEILMFHDRRKIDDLAIYLHRQNIAQGRVRSRKLSVSDALLTALPRITAPIAGIWGEFDATAGGLEKLNRRRTLFQDHQPNAPFVIIPGAGHWVMYEAPDDMVDALMRVIRE